MYGSMNATLKDAQGHTVHTTSSTESNDDAFSLAVLRSTVVSLISSAEHKLSIHKSAEVYAAIQEDIRQVKTVFGARMHSMALEAIGQDLNGQITEAYNNPDWHQKWGRHYLLSLCRAYVLQQCTNFKDPGVHLRHPEVLPSSRPVGGHFLQASTTDSLSTTNGELRSR